RINTDAGDSKSGPRKGVWGQVPPSVLLIAENVWSLGFAGGKMERAQLVGFGLDGHLELRVLHVHEGAIELVPAFPVLLKHPRRLAPFEGEDVVACGHSVSGDICGECEVALLVSLGEGSNGPWILVVHGREINKGVGGGLAVHKDLSRDGIDPSPAIAARG